MQRYEKELILPNMICAFELSDSFFNIAASQRIVIYVMDFQNHNKLCKKALKQEILKGLDFSRSKVGLSSE